MLSGKGRRDWEGRGEGGGGGGAVMLLPEKNYKMPESMSVVHF